MLISTKGRYALRVIVDLAEQPAERFTTLKEIAQRQQISEKYLENIIRTLVKANIVVGVRGKGGGYRLLISPEACTVDSILRLTEDSLAPVACLESETNNCPRKDYCRTIEMWSGLDDIIKNYFGKITISNLIKSGK